MQGLYAIIDLGTLDALQADPVLFAQAVLLAKPAALQLRAKDASARRVLSLLRALLPACRAAEVPLIVNDRPEYAALAGCEFVHIGQTDMSVARARTVAPAVGVGVSTHDMAQLERAIGERPSYVAFGPVYATESKPDAEPAVGVAGLRAAYERARAAGIPLVAVGGIAADRIEAVAPCADAVAIIAALVPPGSPADADWYAAVSARALSIKEAIAAAAKPLAS
jgi:thiamine-phosphate pyrophosphorylase